MRRQRSQWIASPAARWSRCSWSFAAWRSLRGALGELRERLGARQLLRLVDAVPDGVRQRGGVGEPLVRGAGAARRRGGRPCAGAHQRGGGFGAELLLGLCVARVADGHLALLCWSWSAARCRAGAPMPPPRRGAGARASRAASPRVGVELRLPFGERRAELQVPSQIGDARSAVALALFRGVPASRVVLARGGALAAVLGMLFALLLGCDVGGDLVARIDLPRPQTSSA